MNSTKCLTLLIKEKTLSFKEIWVSFKGFDLENIFWILQYHAQLSDSGIKLHFTWSWNLHKTQLFISDKLPHFEEFVKPGKTYYKWQNQSIFFFKKQLHGNISLRFGLEIMEGFSEILRHATFYVSPNVWPTFSTMSCKIAIFCAFH